MKNAVILHGTGGSPEENWFPWLKELLEKRGYNVWVPLLPDNSTPDRNKYNEFLFNQNWDFTDNVIFGHSSGAVSVLNLLADERCPRIMTGVLVGAWADTAKANLNRGEINPENFKDLFPPDGFNFELIKSRADNFLFIHGDNDPYCPLDQAQWLAKQTGSEVIVIPGGGHLGSQFPKFPQMTQALEERGWL